MPAFKLLIIAILTDDKTKWNDLFELDYEIFYLSCRSLGCLVLHIRHFLNFWLRGCGCGFLVSPFAASIWRSSQ